MIAVINQKGGVGKTTTTVNLGAALASPLKKGGRGVVLIDLDPQANLSESLGIRNPAAAIYGVMRGEIPIEQTIIKRPPFAGGIIPATIAMADADIALAATMRREDLLKTALQSPNRQIVKSSDIILIDCPPSLGLLAINALTAADYLLIPVSVEYLPMQGLAHLFETITRVRRSGLNRNLKILGILPTRYDGRNNLHLEVLSTLLAKLPETTQTVIRQNIALAEAPSHGQTIFEYAPKSHGAEDYRRLAEELIKKLKIED